MNTGFDQALLYAISGAGTLPLQLCSDFDVARMELDALLGKSFNPTGPGFQQIQLPWVQPDSRAWSVNTGAQHDKICTKYLAQRSKNPRVLPTIEKLLLVRVKSDVPMVPNDYGDLQSCP